MLRTGRRAAVTAVLVAAVALAACGSDPVDSTVRAGTQADRPAAAATTPATDAGAGAGAGVESTVADTAASISAPAALQFSAPLVGGGEFAGPEQAAGKPVAFWFWAPT